MLLICQRLLKLRAGVEIERVVRDLFSVSTWVCANKLAIHVLSFWT
jgi:hypothetical protein